MMIQRFALVLAFVFAGTSLIYGTSVVDVRLHHNSLDKSKNALYVDIDVRVDQRDHVNLAGQNYRIYYPSDLLSLDPEASKSQLPRQQYSKLLFSNILENIEARGSGALTFDDDLGFANFAVELLNDQEGGFQLSGNDGWVTIATLKFDIVGEIEEVSMVWGRKGLSESYATAFVEIAAWEAPLQTSAVEIGQHIDYNLKIDAFTLEDQSYEINIGPNPSTDFITISTNKEFGSDLKVLVRDLSGKLVQREQLRKGSVSYHIDVSRLQSASYVIDIADTNYNSLFSKKIVVAQ